MSKPVPFSLFGESLAGDSGILQLMDDLGAAMTDDPDMLMLGGGNPAHIPEVSAKWRAGLQALVDQEEGQLEKVLGNYDPPQGNPDFRRQLANLLKGRYGWSLSEANIAITPGGQAAFFYLFNMLAGEFAEGQPKKILLPIAPEYIGYANQGVKGNLFTSIKPKVAHTGAHRFKYRIDFDAVEAALEGVGAVCLSRPTNPSGNVVTDEEILHLAELTKAQGIPLIIDNAYGLPFPGAVYTEATPYWDEHVILTMSLSKLGLPGTRTGIVVANEAICRALGAAHSVVGLANSNIGQALVKPMIESGDLIQMSQTLIKPFYEEKAKHALSVLEDALGDRVKWSAHEAEGAFFLWLWFEELPITSAELYQRLKARKVLVVPGSYFFYGLAETWPHADQCIRVTFSMEKHIVTEGLQIIADEILSLSKT